MHLRKIVAVLAVGFMLALTAYATESNNVEYGVIESGILPNDVEFWLINPTEAQKKRDSISLISDLNTNATIWSSSDVNHPHGAIIGSAFSIEEPNTYLIVRPNNLTPSLGLVNLTFLCEGDETIEFIENIDAKQVVIFRFPNIVQNGYIRGTSTKNAGGVYFNIELLNSLTSDYESLIDNYKVK